jgi:DNA topoisomerase III
VVDRYFRVQNFVQETFWSIRLTHQKDGVDVKFSWTRHRLFDQMSVVVLYERCLEAKLARVMRVQEKPTKKWKPLPLTTVELQKMATRFLRMTGQQAMTVAETLYNRGFISYPRTETDRFDRGMNLRALVQKQTQDGRWGLFAQNLVDGSFNQPRNGRNDDKAHPPIHPVTYAAPTVLSPDESRLYELVTRRFLACCSDDARGMATDVDVAYGDEYFHAHGVIVLEKNYLEVYPYEQWNNTAVLPKYTVGDCFEPTEALVAEGKTSPPGYLTEADLIALMDANGIGTDATMAEHIQKIQDREYVRTTQHAGSSPTGGREGVDDGPAPRPGRGGRGNRVARGGRGGSRDGGGAVRGATSVFIPTQLGVALIEGFDRMNFETSLGKPFLRKEMELQMRGICEGRLTREVVLQESIRQYRRVFHQSSEKLDVLKTVSRRHQLANRVNAH